MISLSVWPHGPSEGYGPNGDGARREIVPGGYGRGKVPERGYSVPYHPVLTSSGGH